MIPNIVIIEITIFTDLLPYRDSINFPNVSPNEMWDGCVVSPKPYNSNLGTINLLYKYIPQ